MGVLAASNVLQATCKQYLSTRAIPVTVLVLALGVSVVQLGSLNESTKVSNIMNPSFQEFAWPIPVFAFPIQDYCIPLRFPSATTIQIPFSSFLFPSYLPFSPYTPILSHTVLFTSRMPPAKVCFHPISAHLLVHSSYSWPLFAPVPFRACYRYTTLPVKPLPYPE